MPRKSGKSKATSHKPHKVRGGLITNTTDLRASRSLSRQQAVAIASRSGGRQGK